VIAFALCVAACIASRDKLALLICAYYVALYALGYVGDGFILSGVTDTVIVYITLQALVITCCAVINTKWALIYACVTMMFMACDAALLTGRFEDIHKMVQYLAAPVDIFVAWIGTNALYNLGAYICGPNRLPSSSVEKQ